MNKMKTAAVLSSLLVAVGLTASAHDASADALFTHGTSCFATGPATAGGAFGPMQYSSFGIGAPTCAGCSANVICPVNIFSDGSPFAGVVAVVVPEAGGDIDCTLTLANISGDEVFSSGLNTNGQPRGAAFEMNWNPPHIPLPAWGLLQCSLPTSSGSVAPFLTGVVTAPVSF